MLQAIDGNVTLTYLRPIKISGDRNHTSHNVTMTGHNVTVTGHNVTETGHSHNQTYPLNMTIPLDTFPRVHKPEVFQP